MIGIISGYREKFYRTHHRRPLIALISLNGVEANSNFVACNIPSPIGVESNARYGTTSRLPASGANHISVSCAPSQLAQH